MLLGCLVHTGAAKIILPTSFLSEGSIGGREGEGLRIDNKFQQMKAPIRKEPSNLEHYVDGWDEDEGDSALVVCSSGAERMWIFKLPLDRGNIDRCFGFQADGGH